MHFPIPFSGGNVSVLQPSHSEFVLTKPNTTRLDKEILIGHFENSSQILEKQLSCGPQSKFTISYGETDPGSEVSKSLSCKVAAELQEIPNKDIARTSIDFLFTIPSPCRAARRTVEFRRGTAGNDLVDGSSLSVASYT
jgi:hypothetical protein